MFEIREQEHHRLNAALFDRERLGCREALLRQRRIGEERLHRESVRALLIVRKAVALLQPRPERRVARGADRDGLALQVLELRDARRAMMAVGFFGTSRRWR